MTKYSLCIIDDNIPANAGAIDDTAMLNSVNLQQLVKSEIKWEEKVLKDFVAAILKKNDLWSVSAFTSPDIYMNYFEEELYRPDVVIFDWEIAGLEGSVDSKLLEILKKSFAIVRIYSGKDNDERIERTIDEDAFKPYKNRVSIIHKEDKDSVTKLICDIDNVSKNNFSFKFGYELRSKTITAIDYVLVELGKTSIDEVVWFFGETDKKGRKVLSPNELVEILVNKIKNDLITAAYIELPPSTTKPTTDDKILKRLWSYRLFYRPSDKTVRKGDIIKKQGQGNDTLYMVISSDCHLNKFWKKNMGYLALVPLHKMGAKHQNLKEKLSLHSKDSELKKIKPSSITNTNVLDGPTVIPLVEIEVEKYENYLLIPKEIFSTNIPFPAKEGDYKRVLSLSYDHIKEYEGNDRIAVSEPFLTPLIQHVMSNIAGYGVPDYPEELKTIIQSNFDEMFKS